MTRKPIRTLRPASGGAPPPRDTRQGTPGGRTATPGTASPGTASPGAARPGALRLESQRNEGRLPDGKAQERGGASERPRHHGHGGSPKGSQGAKAPPGTVWLHGLHPVAAALGNPQRRLRRLLLTEEAETALAAERRAPWPLAAERIDRARLDQMLGRDIVHQGAALLADPLATPTLAHCLERPGPVLVLDQVTDPRNVGAILRSASAFGVACVIAQERNAPEETGVLAKAASGALETVPLLRAVNIVRTLVALRAAGLWIVGLDAAGGALRGPAFAERRVAVVLGAEGAGLRRLTRETCDELAGFPMSGDMASLNVSVAAGVALYELARRA